MKSKFLKLYGPACLHLSLERDDVHGLVAFIFVPGDSVQDHQFLHLHYAVDPLVPAESVASQDQRHSLQ